MTRPMLTVVKTREAAPRARRKQHMNRHSPEELAELRDQLYALCETHQPLTLRNLFYLAVSFIAGIGKNLAYYKLIMRQALKLRRSGVLPWGWIVDSTRWMRKPRSYSSLHELFDSQCRLYRRDLWLNQDAYVEVWCESESLAGVLVGVTAEFDVPLMPGKGYSSHAFLQSAGETIREMVESGKSAHIYYVGDKDPSGRDIERHVQKYLSEYSDRSPFEFERLAVTTEQVRTLRLPTKPKNEDDPRSGSFRGGTVEAEAIEPGVMRQIVRDAIEQHLDDDMLERTRQVEAAERETLARLAQKERKRPTRPSTQGA